MQNFEIYSYLRVFPEFFPRGVQRIILFVGKEGGVVQGYFSPTSFAMDVYRKIEK